MFYNHDAAAQYQKDRHAALQRLPFEERLRAIKKFATTGEDVTLDLERHDAASRAATMDPRAGVEPTEAELQHHLRCCLALFPHLKKYHDEHMAAAMRPDASRATPANPTTTAPRAKLRIHGATPERHAAAAIDVANAAVATAEQSPPGVVGVQEHAAVSVFLAEQAVIAERRYGDKPA